MELVSYLKCQVHITLIGGFYYIGFVVDADENSITLIDKTNKRVSLAKSSIETIREISR